MWLLLLAIGVQVLRLAVSSDAAGGESLAGGGALHQTHSPVGHSSAEDTTAGIHGNQTSPTVPDVNILYGYQKFPGQVELSCVTGDPELTILTDIVPDFASNVNFTDDGQGKNATWNPSGVEAMGVVCRADHTSLYQTFAPLMADGAYNVPAQLSFTINKDEDLTVEFQVVKDDHILWQKLPNSGDNWKEGQIINDQLTIPYHQLKGTGLYVLIPYNNSLNDTDNKISTGTFSLLVRECPAERYGPPGCDQWCGDCMYGGICHDITGQCVCPPGLTGSHCHKRCPDSRIGRDCGVELRHPVGRAVCLPHPLGCCCPPGYTGFKCEQVCDTGSWGSGCLQQCSSYCHYGCDKVTGHCFNQDPLVCAEGERGLPRLRQPPTVNNLSSGATLVQFSAWDPDYDDGETVHGDLLTYLLTYWPKDDEKTVKTALVTHPSTTLTDLDPLTQYNLKVLVEVLRSGQTCRDDGSAGARIHTLTFTSACPGNLTFPLDIQPTEMKTDSVLALWKKVAWYKEVCGLQYLLIVTPVTDVKEETAVVNELVTSLPRLEELSPDTDYAVVVKIVHTSLRIPRSVDSRNTRNGQGGLDITHEVTDSQVIFSWQPPPGVTYFYYRYQTKVNYKACPDDDGQWTNFNRWSRSTKGTRRRKEPYSTMSIRVEFGTTEANNAVHNVEVDPAVPDAAVTSLSCPGYYSTFCSVDVETNCIKHNGPDLSVSYSVKKTSTQGPFFNKTLPASELDSQGKATIQLPDSLLPNTEYLITAYPVNSVGTNTKLRVKKNAYFKTPPAKPGSVTNLAAHAAFESIIVTWGGVEDNPLKGQLEKYIVTWRKKGRGIWEEHNDNWANTVTRRTITGLDNNQEYEVRVAAKNQNVDDYGPYEQVFATPHVPQLDITYNIRDSEVVFSWHILGTAESSLQYKYQTKTLYKECPAASSWSFWSDWSSSTDHSLPKEPHSTMFMKVKVRVSGEEGHPAENSAAIGPTNLPQVSDIQVTEETSIGATINWKKLGSYMEACGLQYRLTVTHIGGTAAVVVDEMVTQPTYTVDNQLEADKEYSVVVQVVNPSQPSTNLNLRGTANFRTTPPQQVISHRKTNHYVTFTWKEPSGGRDNLVSSYQFKTTYKVCRDNIQWSLWSSWSSTSRKQKRIRLAPYSTISFKVKTKNRGGEGESAEASVEVGPEELPQLTGIRTRDVTSNSAFILWEEPKPFKDICELKYQLTITPVTGDTVRAAVVNMEVTLPSFKVDRKLQPNTEYIVEVEVVNSTSSSSRSSRATTNFFTVPGQPTITSQVSINGVTFSWEPPSGIIGQLQYSYQYETKYEACTVAPFWSQWSAWTDRQSTTLRSSYTRRTMRVKAKNTGGEGHYAESSANVGPKVPDAAVTSLSCPGYYLTFCSVVVETNCIKHNGPDLSVTYGVKRKGTDDHFSYYNLPITALDRQGKATIQLPGDLQPYVRYTIAAYPANNVGWNNNTKLRKTTEFTTPPQKPGSVTNLKAQSASNSITVTWGRPGDNPPKGQLERYRVVVRKRNIYRIVHAHNVASTASSYTITDLDSNQAYDIRVFAKNMGVAIYSLSTQVFAFTLEGVPSHVTDLRELNVTQASMTVTWEEPKYPAGEITSYNVTLSLVVKEQREAKVVEHEDKNTILMKTAEFTGLQAGQQYRVDVVACNTRKCSEPSSMDLWTHPEPPEVDDELKLMTSTSTSVTIRLPKLNNPPGWQWIILKNISKEEGEAENRENRNSDDMKAQAEKLVNNIDHLTRIKRNSDPNERNGKDEGPSLRIAALLHQEKDKLKEEFRVGDNKTYNDYHNIPLEKDSQHLLVVVTQKIAGKRREFATSTPIKITAESHVPTSVISSIVVVVVLLLVLVLVVVVLGLYWRRRRAKPRFNSDGPKNELVTYANEDASPRMNIAGIRTHERFNNEETVNPQVAVVGLIPEEEPFSQEEVPLPEQAGKGQDESEYANLMTSVPEVEMEAYLSRAMFSHDTDIEFQSVPASMPKSCSDGELPINRKKNRYKNNLPYNGTRVKLPLINNEPHTDYINACFIKGPNQPKAFIATQGPKDYGVDTIGDFWRMMWHSKSQTIIMVVSLIENGKVKVAKYWPEMDKPLDRNGLKITLVSHEVKMDFVVRVFKLAKGNLVREIKHYQYTAWPDHSVPQNPFGLAQMLKLMRSQPHQGPITVHCSAGIGRTGTVLLVVYLLDQLNATGCISSREALLALRNGRPRLVENTMQYKFGHALLLEMMYGVRTSTPCATYISSLPQLRASSAITNQYRKLKALPMDQSFKFASKPECAHLNRNPDVLPADSRAVFLPSLGGDVSSQYINVVRVNGIDRMDAYIAGEHPLEHTVEMAWRLIMERRISVWIHLHTFPHPHPEYPEIVSGEGIMDVGRMRLTVGSANNFQNFTERYVDIALPRSRIVTPHRVLLLQLKGWSHTLDVPPAPESLLAVLEKMDTVISVDKPALFTCRDGVTGCGVATALLLARARAQLVQEVDVYRSVLSVLYDRPQFITSVEQYDFLHTAMEQYLTENNHYGNFN